MSAKKAESHDAKARRRFLMGAGLAGAAGAVAVASRGTATKPGTNETKPELDPRGGGGYHVTDHVRRYYRSTMV